VNIDLRPYVCILDCCQDQTLFSTRKEWTIHEQSFHWNQWSCKDCSTTFPNLGDFEDHMRRSHSILPAEYHKLELAKSYRQAKPIHSLVPCEICGAVTTLKERPRHVGREMEEIARFVLGPYETAFDLGDESGDAEGDVVDETGSQDRTDQHQSEVNETRYSVAGEAPSNQDTSTKASDSGEEPIIAEECHDGTEADSFEDGEGGNVSSEDRETESEAGSEATPDVDKNAGAVEPRSVSGTTTDSSGSRLTGYHARAKGRGFWFCHIYHHWNAEDLAPERCSQCNHMRCPQCTAE
jgi:hypothetical protein